MSTFDSQRTTDSHLHDGDIAGASQSSQCVISPLKRPFEPEVLRTDSGASPSMQKKMRVDSCCKICNKRFNNMIMMRLHLLSQRGATSETQVAEAPLLTTFASCSLFNGRQVQVVAYV